jgi:hypothetical protein
MTLFPSALRSERPTAMGAPIRPLLGLANLLKRMLAHRRTLTIPTLSLVASHAGSSPIERAEPRLRWTDPDTSPAGDFAASAIPNAELDITTVPRRGESWDAVADFALTYDGYGYWDDLPTLAGRVLQRWTRRRSLPPTLDELRGCLFYEQRRWNHFGEDPTGRSAEYMWAIVDAIGALAAPVVSTHDRVPDPRRIPASETHVKLVPNPAVTLRPVPSLPLTVRPRQAHPGRLMPVPAAEAHVRLVSTIEDSAGEEMAGAVARHPSRFTERRVWGHLSGDPAQHPAMSAARDLKPMPSAEPLPKPPVIIRRARRAGSGTPNRPGAAVNATRAGRDPWPSDGSRWNVDKIDDRPTPTPTPAEVTPLCHEFFEDDDGYRTWVGSNPQGYVLNQPAKSTAPTLHRAGCAVVVWRDGRVPRTTGAVRVCGPNPDALSMWSMARGTGRPNPCRRCCP